MRTRQFICILWARLLCHLTACRQVYRGYNLMGRHDDKPYGVWECKRCGRIRLGRPL